MKTLREMFGQSTVVGERIPESSKRILQAYRDLEAAGFSIKAASEESQILGIELEIEHALGISSTSGFTATTDGSLRNNGREFVSFPLELSTLIQALSGFFLVNKVTEDNYSERCSVHVHANVQDFTGESLVTLLLVYSTLEELLFEFVGEDRYNNIFCVPLNQTRLYELSLHHIDWVSHTLSGLDRRGWYKYTALNLLPISSQGSVEFRHMPGTRDMVKLIRWLFLITRLLRYARTTPLLDVISTINDLNTSSGYDRYVTDIFGVELSQVLFSIPGYRKKLSSSTTGAKILLLGFDADSFFAEQKKKQPPTIQPQGVPTPMPPLFPAATAAPPEGLAVGRAARQELDRIEQARRLRREDLISGGMNRLLEEFERQRAQIPVPAPDSAAAIADRNRQVRRLAATAPGMTHDPELDF
jgi:Putative amidoligase enzyme